METAVVGCGAGTTGATLRAGKPQIICPFVGDQSFWGRRVADLAIGPHPIPQTKLTAKRLADAIKYAVTNTNLQQRASWLNMIEIEFSALTRLCLNRRIPTIEKLSTEVLTLIE